MAYVNSKSKKKLKKKKKNQYLPSYVRYVDYKDIELISKFINTHGRILPARVTGLTASQQRLMSTAIKRARLMALIPFSIEKIRK